MDCAISDEGELPLATEAEVVLQVIVRQTNDKEIRVYASQIVHEGTATRKPQRTKTLRPTACSAFMAPQRSIAQFLKLYLEGARYNTVG